MPDFQFYVTDDRYAVRSLMLVQTRDVCAARRLAERMLRDPHHLAVEVYANDALLFKVGSESDSTPARRRRDGLPPSGAAQGCS